MSRKEFRPLILTVAFLLCIAVSMQAGVNEAGVTREVDSLHRVLQRSPRDVKSLSMLGRHALFLTDASLARDCGRRLLEISAEGGQNSSPAATSGNLILGQALVMSGEAREGYRYLIEARRLSENRGDSSSLASVYNGLAIYTYSHVGDIAGAIDYYHRGLDAASASGQTRLRYLILSNLANTHLERRDSFALQYSRECYDWALANNDYYIMYSSSLGQADMYYNEGDYTRSMRYLDEAERALEHIPGTNPSELYRLRARDYAALGNDRSARQNFSLAKHVSLGNTQRYLSALVSHAEYEVERKNYPYARQLIDSIFAASSDSVGTLPRLRALRLRSVINEGEGRCADALSDARLYATLKDSVNSHSTAMMMSDAMARYRYEEVSAQLARQRIDTLRHQRNFYIALGCGVALLLFIGAASYMHQRLRRLHRSIVDQMRGAMVTEDVLQRRICALEEALDGKGSSSSSAETIESVADAIDRYMESAKPYCDASFSRNSLAEALGTNPTYVSRAIMERHGMNFTKYVNNYRIKEAVRILSNPSDTTPLKAVGPLVGYNSPTSFYTHFKDATGMTPAAFREAAVQG